MNRLVLIGNGFDLAHGLKTRYEDFLNWYWCHKLRIAATKHDEVYNDLLCKMTILTEDSWFSIVFYDSTLKGYLEDGDGKAVYNCLKNNKKVKLELSPFFERIHNSIVTKGWVDIENDYYELLKNYVLKHSHEPLVDDLNNQLKCLQDKLVEYLGRIEVSDKILKTDIRQKIYARFKRTDISIEGQYALIEHIKAGFERDENEWWWISRQYDFNSLSKGFVDDYKKRCKTDQYLLDDEEPPMELMLPNQIMLLNFNYTHTAQLYCKDAQIFSVNQIHGDLDHPSSVIFGYGDELDHDYKSILNKNNNKYLCNIKSIKYLEADNYRKMLSFIESEPYQILIMGHSCGNSDRTLLNTLFEHKNCVSIKPYYYKWGDGEKDDNYIELAQNISRNFKDMKLMRDRVVNKTYCEPLTNRNNN